MRARDFPFFDTRVAAVAHRGGAGHPDIIGRENSLAAFQHAVGLGYRYLETDVHATRDGHLVAFHDDVLDRVTDARGPVRDLTLRELENVRIGGSEAIPTLDSLLETFPDSRFNIDIKHRSAVVPLVKAIERHRAQDRVCVASFSADRIRAFRRLMGRRVPTSVSPAAVLWNRGVPMLPRLLNSPGVAFQLPVSHTIWRQEVTLVTRRLLACAHAVGKVVHVWTVDDETLMNELIDAGVDGIITDRTDTLRSVLTARGIWEGAA